MSFAIIETGGKQYKIEGGQKIAVEKLSDTLKEGEKVTFEKVLLFEDAGKVEIGTPYISGKKVEGKFISNGKEKKIDIIRFRSKSNYHRHIGHRQPFSEIEIESFGTKSALSSKTKKTPSTKKETTKKETTAKKPTEKKKAPAKSTKEK